MVLHGHTWWYYCTKKVFWKSNIKGWKVTISLKGGWFHDDLMDFYRANYCLVCFICFLRGEECAIDLGHERVVDVFVPRSAEYSLHAHDHLYGFSLRKNMFVWVWVCFVCVWQCHTQFAKITSQVFPTHCQAFDSWLSLPKTLHKHVPATHISFWKLCYPLEMI